MTEHVNSADDNRTINNAVRHQYRVLSDEEEAQMVAVKDMGIELFGYSFACGLSLNNGGE